MIRNGFRNVSLRDNAASDDFAYSPTPAWATRALCKFALIGSDFSPAGLQQASCWDPACGTGQMARALAEYFGTVRATDIHDYGYGGVQDFLAPGYHPEPVDFIITNPPFACAGDFVLRAMEFAQVAVAMLVRSSMLEGKNRYYTLLREHPPLVVAPFVERVPMFRSRQDNRACTSVSYMWLIWPGRILRWGSPGMNRTDLILIPPCRKALERQNDIRGAA